AIEGDDVAFPGVNAADRCGTARGDRDADIDIRNGQRARDVRADLVALDRESKRTIQNANAGPEARYEVPLAGTADNVVARAAVRGDAGRIARAAECRRTVGVGADQIVLNRVAAGFAETDCFTGRDD